MESMNYSNARAQLSILLDKVNGGNPVEITQRGKNAAVIISKFSYEAYQKALFDLKYSSISK